MNQNQKQEIKLLLSQYVAQFKSQSQAVQTLKNVSEATVIQILKDRWESISPEMWRTVGKQVGWSSSLSLVETMVFQTCLLYFSISKEHGETFALIGKSGCGKSHAGKWYANSMKGKNVYYLECAGYWNKKYFLQEMIQAMGKTFSGNVYEMMDFIISELRRQDSPMFILDEIDKLNEPVLLFFITLYNKLNKLCGFVWTSTSAIMGRISKNVNRKIGYSELQTRISTFIELPDLNRAEVKELCYSRGITNEEEISRAINECNGGNIRRIDRLYVKQLVRDKIKQSA